MVKAKCRLVIAALGSTGFLPGAPSGHRLLHSVDAIRDLQPLGADFRAAPRAKGRALEYPHYPVHGEGGMGGGGSATF